MIDPLPGPVLERLSRVRSMEANLLDGAEGLGSAVAADTEMADAVSMIRSLAAAHARALDELAVRRGAEPKAGAAGGRPPADGGVSNQLEQLAGASAAAVVAYGALYAAGRLHCEAELCDLADAHAADWARTLHTLSDLLPPAIHADMLRADFRCRCVCPACGIGACLCTRNSVETIREHWGRPGLETGDGIELRISPRPGSQLADAGLERGDRILAVDGQVVHTNNELQAALRRRPVGEITSAQVVRSGRTEEIAVARVSDWE
ncbi:MAG: PDZ domain-containing protein [Candidatus Limnocylindrales bacterium]